MLVNKENLKNERVKFISYTGKYPNLCRGVLTLDIDGEIYKFGSDYSRYWKSDENYDRFWNSGGSCGFTNGYKNSYVNKGEWEIDVLDLPENLRQYAAEIDEVFNANVPYGCCGGCL